MSTTRSKGRQQESESSGSPEPPRPPDIQQLYEDYAPYNPAPNLKATTTAFINYVLNLYEQDSHEGDTLTDVFREDFQMFRKEDWQSLGASRLGKIRELYEREDSISLLVRE